MPVLKNARHEKFAQARASGKSIDDAYVAAGYKRNGGNACRLNENESVAGRIREFQKGAAKIAKVEAADIIAGLIENYKRAAGQLPVARGPVGDDGRPIGPYILVCDLHAANKALELLGKTIGIFHEDAGEKPPMAVIVQYPVEKGSK